MRTIANVKELQERYDLVVVGAGPAGLAAAAMAAELGLLVLLADENANPGGQIYRSVTTTPVKNRDILGEDYWKGIEIVKRFETSMADYAPVTTVWNIDRGGSGAETADLQAGISIAGQSRLIATSHTIIATGALERPFPVPGWTMPGVMTAGAAQIALKSSGLVPEGRVIIAGCGPLFLLLGAQLKAAGANIVAMLDTAPRENWLQAALALPDFLASGLLMKGMRLLAATRSGTRRFSSVNGLAAEGEGNLQRVIVRHGGRSETIGCDILLLHHGVIPNVNMPGALGCALDWNADQHCFSTRVDDWFLSSVEGIYIAGDGAGIGGADAAVPRGKLAALEVARRIGNISEAERDAIGAPVRLKLATAMRGRRFIDLLYRPASEFLAPVEAETIICRCEEVTAGEVRRAVRDLGVQGPNQMKAFLRCGMGPCQGRLCGPTVTELIAAERGVTPDEAGYYRLRPPVKPITVAEIASLPQTGAAAKAVVRY